MRVTFLNAGHLSGIVPCALDVLTHWVPVTVLHDKENYWRWRL